MVLSRTPITFRTAYGRALLADIRYSNMIHSLQMRKSSVFANDDWAVQPWVDDQKTDEQELCDLGFALAALEEKIDTFDDVRVSPISVASWLNQCSRLDDALEEFGYRQSPAARSLPTQTATTEIQSESDDNPHEFGSLSQALAVITSASLRLGLSNAVRHVYDLYLGRPPISSPMDASSRELYDSLSSMSRRHSPSHMNAIGHSMVSMVP